MTALSLSNEIQQRFSLSTTQAVAINAALKLAPVEAWQIISKNHAYLSSDFLLYLFILLFPAWLRSPYLHPIVFIPEEQAANTNLTSIMAEYNFKSVDEFHHFSITQIADFWQLTLKTLDIVFQTPPQNILQMTDTRYPTWLPGAKLNIYESCFTAAPNQIALKFLTSENQLDQITYAELKAQIELYAKKLVTLGVTKFARVAIIMQLSKEAVIAYLALIKLGAVVVSIADSFSVDEMAIRLNITNVCLVLTEDFFVRAGKKIFLYEKVNAATQKSIIVFSEKKRVDLNFNDHVQWWHDVQPAESAPTTYCSPDDACHILFSSGTTGEPKAIPWTHLTPIKSASDAFYHQDIKPNDVLCWPTSLGWMMGPWLIFAALINRASIALYADAPTLADFGKFVQDAKVTMLGVVPSLVAAWHQSKVMEQYNWQAIKLFSSTGECSNPEMMFYLSYLAGFKPIIEYCGGTEIGGSYVSSTLLKPNYAACFNQKVMGIDFVILDDQAQTSNLGEVAIVPPSIGLSLNLLNADHEQIYFKNMPQYQGQALRRHGDLMQHYAHGIYAILGRADDTMNLGGIKISAAEIERALANIENITELAAIGVNPKNHGPTQLVIYVVAADHLDLAATKIILQKILNKNLNPLFKITAVFQIPALPKTPSNKIIRRQLRDETHLIDLS